MKEVISLGIGEPDFTTPQPILEAGIRSLHNGKYPLLLPTPVLWSCARPYPCTSTSLYHVSYDPGSEIVITVGGSEALYLAMTALLNPGEEVIIPTPCFVSYPGRGAAGWRGAGRDRLPHGKQL